MNSSIKNNALDDYSSTERKNPYTNKIAHTHSIVMEKKMKHTRRKRVRKKIKILFLNNKRVVNNSMIIIVSHGKIVNNKCLRKRRM
jgi:hypothetical protein